MCPVAQTQCLSLGGGSMKQRAVGHLTDPRPVVEYQVSVEAKRIRDEEKV